MNQKSLPAEIVGVVVAGKGVGRKLGYPTINLGVQFGPIPPEGVYAATVTIRGRDLPAAAFIERAQGAGKSETVVEAHLLGVSEDYYGATARVTLLKFFRAPRRFRDDDALRDAIAADIAEIKAFLGA